jgi:hypothetical protein
MTAASVDLGNSYRMPLLMQGGFMMMDPDTLEESSSDKTTETGQQGHPPEYKSGSMEQSQSEQSKLSQQQAAGAKSVLLSLHRQRLAVADERKANTNNAVIDGKLKALNAAYFGIVSQYPEII